MKKIVGFFVCLLCLGFAGAAVAQTQTPETAPQKDCAAVDLNTAIPAEAVQALISEVQKNCAAAKRGDADAQYKLGLMYAASLYVVLDQEQATEWLRKAAEQGHVGAQWELTQRLTREEAAEWRQRYFMKISAAAERGDADAQFKLGEIYRWGRGVAVDQEQAIVWYRKAAAQGHLVAQWALGKQLTGDEAVKWMHKAAEGGYAEAQYDLGVMYLEGNSVAKDAAQAVEWLRKAAEHGSSGAAYDLGNMYRDGKDVAQDDAQAVAWYRKAAAADPSFLSMIQQALGDMYVQGRGIAPDREQAIAWVRKAASEGDGVAQYALGEMYLHGNGVKADQDQAFFWLQKAVNDNQNDPAAEALECFGQSPNCLEYEGDEDDGD